ncbi:MAG: hypothetical protein AB1349_12615 [Elusimicrobiota bacterium]
MPKILYNYSGLKKDKKKQCYMLEKKRCHNNTLFLVVAEVTLASALSKS